MWLTVDWVRRRIRFSTRKRRINLARLREKGGAGCSLVRIDRGTYLNVADLPANATNWEIRRMITIARMFALVRRLKSATSVVFTAEAAVLAQGLDSWWNNPDIVYRAPVPRRRKTQMSEVRVGSVLVPAVQLRHITGGLQVEPRQCKQEGGLTFAPVDTIVVDLSRTVHPLQAFVAICSLMHHLTGFSNRHQERARIREERLRFEILNSLKTLAGQRHCRTATALMVNVDAGIESPMEAALLWCLKCGLPPSVARQAVTQQQVIAYDHIYYLDVSFPSKKIVLEVDGAGKFGNSQERFDRQANYHVRRHQHIVSNGWVMIHVVARDLGSVRLVEIVQGAAVLAGLCRPGSKLRMCGRMWKPLGAEQFAWARRY